jgi:hypothetical protein
MHAKLVSQISGTVRDASGGAVPGAVVTVTQTDTALTRTAESDANGFYFGGRGERGQQVRQQTRSTAMRLSSFAMAISTPATSLPR